MLFQSTKIRPPMLTVVEYPRSTVLGGLDRQRKAPSPQPPPAGRGRGSKKREREREQEQEQ